MKAGNGWKVWTEAEIAILRTHYPNGGWAACREAGLARGRETTQSKAHALGIREAADPEWSPQELRVLKSRHGELTGHEAARSLLPRRTMAAIRRKARELQLKLPKRQGWTHQEDAVLDRHYRSEGPGGVARRLPQRSTASIKSRAQIRGLTVSSHRAWSHRDEERLKTLYPQVGARGCAHALKRSLRSIGARALELGLRVDRKRLPSRPRRRRSNEYSAAEDAIVVEFYPLEGGRRTAERLPGRDHESVQSRVKQLRRLGVRVDSQWTWTDDELAVLQEHYPNLGRAGTAALLPRKTPRAVQRRAALLGIRMSKGARRGPRAAGAEAGRKAAGDAAEKRGQPIEPGASEVRDGNGVLVGYSAWDGRSGLTTATGAKDGADRTTHEPGTRS